MSRKHFFSKAAALVTAVAFSCIAAYGQSSPASMAKYKIADGADLRILDDNIWDYSKDTIPPKWQAIGEDPRDFVRAPQFARLVIERMPDVFALQEYSSHMHKEFYPKVQSAGYEIAWESKEDWNNTPIFYYPETMELIYVNYHKYTPEQWCNKGTKSFTSAVLKRKYDEKVYALISTHLWWKSESVMAGSNNARTEQMKNIMAEAERLREKHDCPIFLMGDLNCNLLSEALKNVVANGYRPAWEIATVYGDLRCGHHKCDKNGFSRKQNKTDDGFGCIDHFFIYDPSCSVEVKTFVRDYAWFTVKLTDHYPNYADLKL
jgi:endonuclease/exonuclease/phosphatase family metal-dependent hydrolase